MIVFAKGITSGTVPMGGVIVSDNVHAAFMNGPEHMIELFHGYTYSAHPLACAAALATVQLYEDEGLFERAKKLEPLWAERAGELRNCPAVADIRSVGLAAGIDLSVVPAAAARIGHEIMHRAFADESMMVRGMGNTLIVAPPLIVSEPQIDQIFTALDRSIRPVHPGDKVTANDSAMFVEEAIRRTPVHGEYDVVVVGGGPSGIAAAAAAASHGCRTLLIERYGFLGGMGTAAGVTNFFGLYANVYGEIRQVVHGICDELLERIDRLGGLNEPHIVFNKTKARAYDTAIYKCAADQLLLAKGVDVLFHALAVRHRHEARW